MQAGESLEERIARLRQSGLSTNKGYNHLLREMSLAKLEFNEQVARYHSSQSRGKRRVALELSRHFLANLGSVAYLTEEGLATVISETIDAYVDSSGTPTSRIVNVKHPQTGRYVRIFEVVHAFMNQEISTIMDREFPDFFDGSSAYSELRILTGIDHDRAEDEEEINGIPIQVTIGRKVGQYDQRFWYVLRDQERESARRAYHSIMTGMSRSQSMNFEAYLIGLFTVHVGGESFWQPEDILLELDLHKFRDSFDNSTDQGRFRSLQLQDSRYDHLGLTNSDRMVGNLKSAALINMTADYLTRLHSDNKEVPPEVLHTVSWLYLQNYTTLRNLNQIITGIWTEYRAYPQGRMIKALESAIKQHIDTPDILSANPPEHDLQYYLDEWDRHKVISPSIFNGTIQVIGARMNRLHREPLYADLTKDYHLLKFMTHVYGLRAMLQQTITDKGFNVVRGFANLPEKISSYQ